MWFPILSATRFLTPIPDSGDVAPAASIDTTLTSAEDRAIEAIRSCTAYYWKHPVPVTARSRPTCRGESISESQYTAWRTGLAPSVRARMPSPRVIRETFGSWNAAKAAAGLAVNTAPRTDYASIRSAPTPASTGKQDSKTPTVTAEDAYAAISEWRTWQDGNLDLAPAPYGSWRKPAVWRRSMSEYDAWRFFVAHGAPTIAQVRTATRRTWTELRDGDPTWLTPTPAQRARLYRDQAPDGTPTGVRDGGTLTVKITRASDPHHPVTLTIDATTTWAGLHDIIQEQFDHEPDRLYQFQHSWVVAQYLGSGEDNTAVDVPIGDVLSVGATVQYLYDFRDKLWHTIEVLAVSPRARAA